MKRAIAIVAAMLSAGAAWAAPTVEDLRDSYRATCVQEAGGGAAAAKTCGCMVNMIDASLAAEQHLLAYTVLVADHQGLDDGAAASSIGQTVASYVKLRDALRGVEASAAKMCGKPAR